VLKETHAAVELAAAYGHFAHRRIVALLQRQG
jgi:hypothetical protein